MVCLSDLYLALKPAGVVVRPSARESVSRLGGALARDGGLLLHVDDPAIADTLRYGTH